MDKKVIINIEKFSGPFELLYFLIKKNKFDLYDIPINVITEQYLDYLFAMKTLNLEIASEFLVMASTLLHIKSRSLVPKHNDDEEENDDDQIDSKEELILRLIEYKKYRQITKKLSKMNEKASLNYYKGPESIEFKKYFKEGIHNTSEFYEAYKALIENININIANNEEKMKKISKKEKVTVMEKMRFIVNSFKKKTKLIFNEMFNKSSKLEKATSFMAILELSRINKIKIYQKNLFGEIILTKDGNKDEVKDT